MAAEFKVHLTDCLFSPCTRSAHLTIPYLLKLCSAQPCTVQYFVMTTKVPLLFSDYDATIVAYFIKEGPF